MNAPARVWAKDHTLWSPDPAEIVDRLGWLDVAERMADSVEELSALADEVRAEGVRRVVLLGMGGSSLAPEVLSQSLGGREGWPRLTVLDSTIPARIAAVSREIEPSRALFVVSSKSGTTIEPNALYAYFRRMVEESPDVGAELAGGRFVAVTDADTPLDALARRDGFRRIFRNPEDIGGRYSALSCFGLLPAALIGGDTRALLTSAIRMQAACSPSLAAADNAGAWFGAAMAGQAIAGRDKLTLLASPALASFGLWAEQLIAESLGKRGRGAVSIGEGDEGDEGGEGTGGRERGIIPIAGEPPLEPSQYGDDRQFVYLKLASDDSPLDALADRLAAASHPVIRFEIDDASALGGEFYRWEFATAIAGALLGVHPFDQPDVQQAKAFTERALAEFESSDSARRAPPLVPSGSIAELASGMDARDCLAILAYIEQTPQTDAALSELRASITARYGVATTLGYGPRYLHSSGQLHKGGASGIAALMLVASRDEDAEIPGRPYTFGDLADAQARGDLAALRRAGRATCVLEVSSDCATLIPPPTISQIM